MHLASNDRHIMNPCECMHQGRSFSNSRAVWHASDSSPSSTVSQLGNTVCRTGQGAAQQGQSTVVCPAQPVQGHAFSLSCCSSDAPIYSPTLPATFESSAAKRELHGLYAGRSLVLPTGAAFCWSIIAAYVCQLGQNDLLQCA